MKLSEEIRKLNDLSDKLPIPAIVCTPDTWMIIKQLFPGSGFFLIFVSK